MDNSMGGFGTPVKFSKYKIKSNDYIPTNLRIESGYHFFHQNYLK